MSKDSDYIVGLAFNPSGDENVTKVKELASALIDFMLEFEFEAEDGRQASIMNNSMIRAVDTVADATMLAVRAITKPPFGDDDADTSE